MNKESVMLIKLLIIFNELEFISLNVAQCKVWTLMDTGAKTVLGPKCMIPFIYGIIQSKTGLAPGTYFSIGFVLQRCVV